MVTEHKQDPLLTPDAAISWWSWRPGFKPLSAFLFGGMLTLLALFLLVNGLTTLFGSILDSQTAPVHVPGIVIGHTKDILGSPELVIHMDQSGLPTGLSTEITLVVTSASAIALSNGSHIMVDYAPHLHTPSALESDGHVYPLPGNNNGNSLSSLILLLFGLILLPYPCLLACWGWLDLRSNLAYQETANVVALRSAKQTTNRTPGMVPRIIRTWHGVALQPEGTDPEHPNNSTILTFGIQPEIHARLQPGDKVQITYSRHLHHVYTIKSI
jgi:hypothetical protein